MAHVRRNLTVKEVSLCKRPANPGAVVALLKLNDEPSEDKMPKFKIDLEKIPEEIREAFAKAAPALEEMIDAHVTEAMSAETTRADEAEEKAEALTEANEELEGAAKEADEKAKKAKGDKDEGIDKSSLDPKTKAAFEKIEADNAELAKAQTAKDEELAKAAKAKDERIAKLEDESLTAKMADLAKSFDRIPLETDAMVKLFKGVTDDQLEVLKTMLTALSEQIKTGKLFEEVGKGGKGSSATAFDELTVKGEDLRKADPKLTKEQAFSKACDSDPELFQKHQAEHRTAAH